MQLKRRASIQRGPWAARIPNKCAAEGFQRVHAHTKKHTGDAKDAANKTATQKNAGARGQVSERKIYGGRQQRKAAESSERDITMGGAKMCGVRARMHESAARDRRKKGGRSVTKSQATQTVWHILGWGVRDYEERIGAFLQ